MEGKGVRAGGAGLQSAPWGRKGRGATRRRLAAAAAAFAWPTAASAAAARPPTSPPRLAFAFAAPAPARQPAAGYQTLHQERVAQEGRAVEIAEEGGVGRERVGYSGCRGWSEGRREEGGRSEDRLRFGCER